MRSIAFFLEASLQIFLIARQVSASPTGGSAYRSAFPSCRHGAAQAVVGNGPRNEPLARESAARAAERVASIDAHQLMERR
jgi:hypothetical protein